MPQYSPWGEGGTREGRRRSLLIDAGRHNEYADGMPPPPLPAAQVLKVRLIGDLNLLSPWNVGLHIRYSGAAPAVVDLETYGTTIANAFTNNLAPLMPIANRLTEVQLVDLTSNTSASTTVVTAVPGTRAGTAFSAQVALVSSWKILARWRGGHCRNYWPFAVIADALNNRQWTDAFRSLAGAGFANFRAAISGTGWGSTTTQMVCLSRFTNIPVAGTRRDPPVPFPITDVLVHPRIDTQRRRLGKEHV